VYELLRHEFITSSSNQKVQKYTFNIDPNINKNLDKIIEEDTPMLTPE